MVIRRVGLVAAIGLLGGLGLGCSKPSETAGDDPFGKLMMNEPSVAAPNANAGSAAMPIDTSQAGSAAEPMVAGASGEQPMQQPPTDMMPSTNDMDPPGNAMMPEPGMEMAMDQCGLDTGFDGDEYCILPPPKDKGFQLRIGPSNYENPEPQYILAVDEETTDTFTTVSGNDTARHFYFRQFRQRPGAHHNIVTASGGLAGALGHRIATSNLLAEDNPKGGIIAPENQGVGVPIEANADLSVSLHSINIGDKPLLREVWINFWYVDEDKVTEEAQQLFEAGDVTFAVAPGQDTVLGPFSCDIPNDGRMLWFYGHRHANNVRFSAWRVRGAQRDLFYEGLHWEDPLVLEYSSTVTNTAPDLAKGIEGGWSGILDLKAGDQLEWECHIINQTEGTLRFTNNTFTGEMCIMDGELIGTNCE